MNTTTLALLALLGAPSTALAVPQPLAHQGRLVDAEAGPLDGEVELSFALWDAAEGGNLLWSETLRTELEDGYYSLLLGDGADNPIEDWMLAETGLHLELAVEGEAPMAPRLPLTATPYARRAEVAEVCEAVAWEDVVDVPEDLLDGDSDVLAALGSACEHGDLALWDAAGGAWRCESPVDQVLTEAEVVGYVTGAAIDLAAGSTMGGLGLSTGPHTTSLDWTALTGVPAGFADGVDDDTVLSEDDVLSYVLAGPLDLPADSTVDGEPISTGAHTTSLAWTDLADVPAGFADEVDDDTLGGMSCASGESPRWSGSGWSCADLAFDGTLAGNLSVSGTAWFGSRVGIGDSSPSSALEVDGGIEAWRYHLYGSTDETLSAGTLQDGFRFYGDSDYGGTDADYAVFEKTDSNQNDPDGGVAFVNRGMDGVQELALVIRGSGRVGVGVASPSYALEVDGYVAGQDGLCIGSDCRTSWPASSSGSDSDWTISGSTMYAGVSGNVGIGTSSPATKLHVNGDLRIDETLSGPSDTALILQSQSGRAILFQTSGSNERMRITSDGLVGIGEDDPDAELHVAGRVKAYQVDDAWAVHATSEAEQDDKGAVRGEATYTGAHNTVGVWGIVSATGNSLGQPIGVRGDAKASSNAAGQFGVLGYNWATGDRGDNGGAGVWGGSVNTPGDEGDFSAIGHGVQGETYSTANGAAGGWFVSRSTSGEGEGVYAQTKSSDADSYAVFGAGPTGSTGSKSAIVYTESQGPTELYVEESTELWFSDYGEASLDGGYAWVELDPLFMETVTIDEDHAMHVFVQTYGSAEVYVQRQDTGFEVIQVGGGNPFADFSYRVVARRRFHEERRLRAANVSVDMHMRPDLDAAQRAALNAAWGLDPEDVGARRAFGMR